MMYGQFCRIERKAGGAHVSDRAFIRAALQLIRPRHRYAREARELRHKWLREGLEIRRRVEANTCWLWKP